MDLDAGAIDEQPVRRILGAGQDVVGLFWGQMRGNVLDFHWQEPANPAAAPTSESVHVIPRSVALATPSAAPVSVMVSGRYMCSASMNAAATSPSARAKSTR